MPIFLVKKYFFRFQIFILSSCISWWRHRKKMELYIFYRYWNTVTNYNKNNEKRYLQNHCGHHLHRVRCKKVANLTKPYQMLGDVTQRRHQILTKSMCIFKWHPLLACNVYTYLQILFIVSWRCIHFHDTFTVWSELSIFGQFWDIWWRHTLTSQWRLDGTYRIQSSTYVHSWFIV